jgi:pimeloyl-ACP methyl ester carboxylesterase
MNPAPDAVARANGSGRQPVIFVHGLWLKTSAWDRWAAAFEEAGYIALAPSWPGEAGDPAPETIGRVADHFGKIASALTSRPAIVGHSFGGLIAQILAGRGLSAVSTAIDPAPFRGVLPLPFSALRSAWPVLRNPANLGRRVSLTPAQFRYAFANEITEAESQALYEAYAAPAPGLPIFQAAAANLNPWTQARVDSRTDCRGPLLVISGERDHTVPPDVARAAFKLQARNPSAITEWASMPGRGHSLTIDSGWREVANTVLSFIKRFV